MSRGVLRLEESGFGHVSLASAENGPERGQGKDGSSGGRFFFRGLLVFAMVGKYQLGLHSKRAGRLGDGAKQKVLCHNTEESRRPRK